MPPEPQKPHRPQAPLILLITSGETTVQTTPATEDFSSILRLVEAAVAAKIDLLQIREKRLRVNVLHELSASAAKITRGSATRLLINDRSDIAFAVGADGVHLTTQSLPADVVRRTFGDDFLIGASTHSLEEAEGARTSGADFVVFGPVFNTPNKRQYVEPQGLGSLEKVASALSPFPVLALGGVMTGNVAECIQAGARGIAGIRMFNDPPRVQQVVNEIRAAFEKTTRVTR